MSTFEFVAVLISIVVGLGVTRILSGLSSLFEHRSQVRLDGLTLLWAANTLFFHITFWWVVVGNARSQPTWSLGEFGALFLYGTVLYFLATLILPATCADGPDLRVRYEVIRRPFFASWAMIIVLEVTDTLLRGGWHRVFVELGPPYVALMGVGLLTTIAAFVSPNRRLHWLLVCFMTMANVAWVVGRFGQI